MWKTCKRCKKRFWAEHNYEEICSYSCGTIGKRKKPTFSKYRYKWRDNMKLSEHPKRGTICFLIGLQTGIIIGMFLVSIVEG